MGFHMGLWRALHIYGVPLALRATKRTKNKTSLCKNISPRLPISRLCFQAVLVSVLLVLKWKVYSVTHSMAFGKLYQLHFGRAYVWMCAHTHIKMNATCMNSMAYASVEGRIRALRAWASMNPASRLYVISMLLHIVEYNHMNQYVNYMRTCIVTGTAVVRNITRSSWHYGSYSQIRVPGFAATSEPNCTWVLHLSSCDQYDAFQRPIQYKHAVSPV